MCATVSVRWLGNLAARWMNMALYRACNSSFWHNPTMAHHRFCCLFVGPTSYLGKRSDVVFLMWQLLLINQPFTTILFYINSRWLFQYKESKLWKYNFTLGLYFLGTEHCLQKTLQGMRYCIVPNVISSCFVFQLDFLVLFCLKHVTDNLAKKQIEIVSLATLSPFTKTQIPISLAESKEKLTDIK